MTAARKAGKRLPAMSGAYRHSKRSCCACLLLLSRNALGLCSTHDVLLLDVQMGQTDGIMAARLHMCKKYSAKDVLYYLKDICVIRIYGVWQAAENH